MESIIIFKTAIMVATILGVSFFMRALYAHMVLQDENAELRALIYLQCSLAVIGILVGSKFMAVFCLSMAAILHIVTRPFDPVPVEIPEGNSGDKKDMGPS